MIPGRPYVSNENIHRWLGRQDFNSHMRNTAYLDKSATSADDFSGKRLNAEKFHAAYQHPSFCAMKRLTPGGVGFARRNVRVTWK